MNKKNFMMKSARLLAGIMTVATVATPIIGIASTINLSGPITTYRAGRWTPDGIIWDQDLGITDKRLDRFGEYTMDGEVVWCVEPSILTNKTAEYSSDGDDAIINGTTIRSIHRTEDHRSALYFKEAAFFTWLAYKATDEQVDEIKEYANSIGQNNFAQEVDFIRSGDKDTKWMSLQLLIWYTVTFVVTYDHEGVTPSVQKAVDHYTYQNIESIYQTMRKVGDSLMDNGLLNYEGGFKLYSSNTQIYGLNGLTTAQRQLSNGGNFSLETKRPIKLHKEFANLNNGVSNKPNFNPAGIKFGVYSDVNATQKVGELTLDQNGESNTLKVKRGTYYGYELDQSGSPIKTGAQEVVNGTDATKGYVSGKDKASQNKYVTWEVGQGGSEDPVMATFENMPEVVNFTFKKEIADPKVAALGPISDQYTRKGAEYTLYSDANASQEVTKNGKPVVAVVDENGVGRFEGLYRGRYWVKETKVPTDDDGFTRFDLDKTVHPVDLSTGDEGETTVTNSTTTITKSFTFLNKFESLEKTKEPQGSLVIKKKDAETKTVTAQGQATLAGGEFKVEFFKKGSLGQRRQPKKLFEAVYRTDDKGEIDVRKRAQKVSSTADDELDKMFTAYEGKSKEWGAYDYRVTEIKAPNGYKLTETEKQPKNFVVKDGQTDFTWTYDDGSFYNHDLELHLIKTQRASGDWLPQAEADKILIANANFELTNKNTNQKFTAKTDAQGKLKFDGVIAGEYTLRETSVEKYLTNGQVIDLTVAQQDGTTKLTANSTSKPTDANAPYSVSTNNDGDIEVKYQNSTKPVKGKLIKANEKGAKLQGAKFKLVHYGEDGTTKVDEKELTTNAKGEFEFNELTVGHWYTLEEIQAPDGYKLPAKRKTVKFRAESIPAKNSYALSYQISELDKTNENNTKAVTGDVKKITAEGKMVDGIKFDANETEGTMALEFDVVNNTWQKLPATGSVYGAVAGAAALVVVIGSLVFYVKKRED